MAVVRAKFRVIWHHSSLLPISDSDYEQAECIWHHYKMTKFAHYHDHYLIRDVLLLTDCIESFRQDTIREHGIDCLHFPSLPGMVLQVALKKTGIELDLMTDANMFNMIESGIHHSQNFNHILYTDSELQHCPFKRRRAQEGPKCGNEVIQKSGCK